MGRRPSKLAASWAGLAAITVLGNASFARADWVGGQLDRMTHLLEASIASGDYGVALSLIFLAGLLTSLTPCVYPMVAITVSVFGARQAKTWIHGAGLSLAFVLGMATLFTGLGVTVGAVGGIFGDWLSNPIVVGVIAVVFVFLALGMFGVYELNLPPAMQNRLAQVGGVGPVGAFTLGLVTSLLAAPCVGPPLLALLGYIGASGDMGFGALAMFTYALGLGILFLVVGTFSVSLPKSGYWLEWTKSLFGALMLVMALYYLGNFLPFRPSERASEWIIAGGVLVALGLVGGAIHLNFHGGLAERIRKALGLTAFVLGLTAAVWWLQASPPITSLASADGQLVWLDDYDAAKALATDEKRPMLVDFTASWCGACGEMDRETFHDPEVVAALSDLAVVPVKVDLSPDKVTDERRALLKRYQERGGLPLLILHDKEGKELDRVTKFVDAQEFLAFLAQLDPTPSAAAQ